MDEHIQRLKREGLLTERHMERQGLVWVGVRNLEVMRRLVTEHGFIHVGQRTTAGVDCGGWTHCGPECCGPCPTCGDSPKRRRGHEQAKLWAPPGMSKTKAKSLAHKVMVEVDGGSA